MAKNKQGRTGVLIAGLGFGVAVGVALGALVIAPNSPDGGHTSAAADDGASEQEVAVAEAQASSADAVVSELAGKSVAGTLTDRPVLVLRTADAADEDVDGISRLLREADAVEAGTITLTEKFTDQQGADKLKTIVTNTLPTGAQLSEEHLDPGTHAGQALGSALMLAPDSGEPQANDDEREALLGALADAGYLEYERGTIRPAQVVVVVTGGADGAGETGFGAQVVSNLVEAMQERGNGVVLAGRIGSASDTGAIGLTRAAGQGDEGADRAPSTVDSVDRSWGRIATVLAVAEQLEGRSGAYGSAESAEAATPQVPDAGSGQNSGDGSGAPAAEAPQA